MHRYAITPKQQNINSRPFLPLEALNALPHPLAIINEKHQFIFANHAFQEIFGIGEAKILSLSLREVLNHNYALHNFIANALQSHKGLLSGTCDFYTMCEKKQAAKICDATLTPLSFTEGDVQQFLFGFKLRDKELNTGAVRSLKRFSSMLAHEVKNPLSGIQGAAQLLSRSVPERDKDLTSLIYDETKRIQKLVDQLACFSEDEPLAFEAVNIHAVLNHVKRISQLGFASHVEFTEDYDPSLPEVSGDTERLIQAFINLFKNSAEAMNKTDPAILNVKTFYCQGKHKKGLPTPFGICISDKGEGVPEEKMDLLFDPFYSTKSTGAGLGLSVVAKIIEEHRGQLKVVSKPHFGTQFYIYLPLFKKR